MICKNHKFQFAVHGRIVQVLTPLREIGPQLANRTRSYMGDTYIHIPYTTLHKEQHIVYILIFNLLDIQVRTAELSFLGIDEVENHEEYFRKMRRYFTC